MKLTSVLKRKSDVRFRVVGEEGVVVRQEAAEVLALNGVGARVLELFDRERPLAEVIDRLMEEYEIGRAELESEVCDFVTELTAAGVLESIDLPGDRG